MLAFNSVVTFILTVVMVIVFIMVVSIIDKNVKSNFLFGCIRTEYIVTSLTKW